jgi:hypothetical protein
MLASSQFLLTITNFGTSLAVLAGIWSTKSTRSTDAAIACLLIADCRLQIADH